MDNNTINDILKAGLNEIDDELAMHEAIRELSKDFAQRIRWGNVLDAEILNEYGQEVPYLFVLKPDTKDAQGNIIVTIEVTDVYKLEQVYQHNTQILGGNFTRYTPAAYSAPLDGEHEKDEIIQTLLATAIARIKGILLVEEMDDEE